MDTNYRDRMKDKKRIVIKVGSSSITHPETGKLNLEKIEKLMRQVADIKGMGKDVVLVSSGAMAAGRQTMGTHKKEDESLPQKQAYAAIGQTKLMMVYQRISSSYSIISAQVLMTKSNMIEDDSRFNTQNTFEEILHMGAVPIVNENDTISTYEIRFGDNDRLSAIVASIIDADLLILLSDIEGLYTADPHKDKNAKFIDTVEQIDDSIISMATDGAGSEYGTGGMSTKIEAARIATDSGCDMIIANADDMNIISDILAGKDKGTLFLAHKNTNFDLNTYMHESEN